MGTSIIDVVISERHIMYAYAGVKSNSNGKWWALWQCSICHLVCICISCPERKCQNSSEWFDRVKWMFDKCLDRRHWEMSRYGQINFHYIQMSSSRYSHSVFQYWSTHTYTKSSMDLISSARTKLLVTLFDSLWFLLLQCSHLHAQCSNVTSIHAHTSMASILIRFDSISWYVVCYGFIIARTKHNGCFPIADEWHLFESWPFE